MRVVFYRRVSTARQGNSGLGLAAQQRDLDAWLDRHPDAQLVGEFTEVESGKKDDRPALDAALKRCRLTGAKLVAAKLDRLSRSAEFLFHLQNCGVDFLALDVPKLSPLTLAIYIGLAQEERETISSRTKKALAAKKAQLAERKAELTASRDEMLAAGADAEEVAKLDEQIARCRLGNPNGSSAFKVNGGDKGREAQGEKADSFAKAVAEVLVPMKAEGATLRAMAAKLMELGVLTQRGGSTWTPTGVKRVLDRIG